jgi:hypothetical protein
LRRFETAAHLTRLRGQIVTVISITWLPVMMLALLRVGTGGRVDPIIRDAGVQVRLLVAAPILLLLDQMFPPACRSVLRQLTEQSFVPAGAMPRFVRLLRRVTRLGDSPWPECVLGLGAVALGIAVLVGRVPLWSVGWRGSPTPARIWYAMTDVPLFQFLLWRALWRWVIWVGLLVGLSRIELDLVPTHPDRRGGIGVLRLSSMGYCAMMLFAISSVICAEWGMHATIGTSIASWRSTLALFGTVAVVIDLGPLLLFSRHLVRARRAGIEEMGGLAAAYGRRFRGRQLLGRDRDEPLDTLEIDSLANIDQTYKETIERLRSVLFDRRDIALLLVATFLPMVPLMLLRVPRSDWLELLGMLTGSRL